MYCAVQLEQNIQQSRVDRMDFVGPKIPQQVIDLLETRRNVIAVLIIGRRQFLAGVRVHERQRPLITARRAARNKRHEGKRDNATCKSATIKLRAIWLINDSAHGGRERYGASPA